MSISMQQKKSTVELLAIVFDDNEFLPRTHAVNAKTKKLTEDLMINLNYCNNATTALLTGIRCLPKSKNVYGWLLGCLPAILAVFKANKTKLKTNLFCSAHVIAKYKDPIKVTLL